MVRVGESAQRVLMLKGLRTAIEASQPEALLRDRVKLIGGRMLSITETKIQLNLKRYDRIIIVGAGKAAGGMAVALESVLGPNVEFEGTVIVPEGIAKNYKTRKVIMREATHPRPSKAGIRATKQVLDLLRSSTKKSLVVCLFSGGGSSLMTLPANGILLHEKRYVIDLLLSSGAIIEEVNCVRKHLSRVKGGLLADYTNGARILNLLISDVVGNPLDSIASGPTVADSSTFRQAIHILKKYNVEQKVPRSIITRFEKGVSGSVPETLKKGNAIFNRVQSVLIGDNATACRAAALELSKEIKPVYYLGSEWQGEAREVGRNFASMIVSAAKSNFGQPFTSACAFVWGGETTVTVSGNGSGGRNQEEALSALDRIRNQRHLCMGFIGTDGKDGNSDCAGAIVDYSSFRRALKKKVQPSEYLRSNDSFNFFRKIGASLLQTGPTGTNVADIGIAILDWPAN